MSSVDIVIVNWNAGPQLAECVASVFAQEGDAIGSVTVVDNASRDGSADFARGDPRVRLIEPGRNLGFGAACNLGAAGGAADFILFLNPDTRLLRPTLRAVAVTIEAEGASQVAVCGVRLVGEDGTTSRHCARLPSAWTFFALSTGLSKAVPWLFRPVELVEFDHDHDADVPHVMGAFYCVRRAVFDAVGGFDPAFFVFYEDLDLSLRIARAGHAIRYLASQSIFHRTGGTSAGARAKALSYLLESRLIYTAKHHGRGGRLLVRAGVWLIEPLRRLLQAAVAGSPDHMRETIRAYRRLVAIVRSRPVDRT